MQFLCYCLLLYLFPLTWARCACWGRSMWGLVRDQPLLTMIDKYPYAIKRGSCATNSSQPGMQRNIRSAGVWKRCLDCTSRSPPSLCLSQRGAVWVTGCPPWWRMLNFKHPVVCCRCLWLWWWNCTNLELFFSLSGFGSITNWNSSRFSCGYWTFTFLTAAFQNVALFL